MCVCIFVIPQDLWRCPCPSESSGLTPLASLLCPAPPIMNGCMKAAVFVGTRRKIPDFPTSHVQVCLIWWEPGGVGAACRSHSRDFFCCPDWCPPADLAPPYASVSEFPTLSWKWKKYEQLIFPADWKERVHLIMSFLASSCLVRNAGLVRNGLDV